MLKMDKWGGVQSPTLAYTMYYSLQSELSSRRPIEVFIFG